jgi:hypothetical protein
MDHDNETQRTCECNHPMGHYDGGKPMHIRKGCEYSITCWLCGCRQAVEKMNDIRAKETPPERVDVMSFVKEEDR